MKSKEYIVGKDSPTTIGRSSKNTISLRDLELSRTHTKITFDRNLGVFDQDIELGRFSLEDLGSTNGTYVLLTGPMHGPYPLGYDDHFIVGKTGFSVNRFDFGVREEIGLREAMEDATVIVQNLRISSLEKAIEGGDEQPLRLYPQVLR